MKPTFGALPVALLIGGCSVFTPPKEQPVQREYVGEFFGAQETNVFTLTPERRTIIVQTSKEVGARPRFCAEPAADVAESLASSFRAVAEASAAERDDTRRAATNLELSRNLSTSVVSLFYRSQGVQLFRDGLFSLCQAYMNGLITSPDDYMKQYDALLNRSFALIAQEIPSAQTLRAVELSNQIANMKTAVESALQKAQAAESESIKAADRARDALKQIEKDKTD